MLASTSFAGFKELFFPSASPMPWCPIRRAACSCQTGRMLKPQNSQHPRNDLPLESSPLPVLGIDRTAPSRGCSCFSACGDAPSPAPLPLKLTSVLQLSILRNSENLRCCYRPLYPLLSCIMFAKIRQHEQHRRYARRMSSPRDYCRIIRWRPLLVSAGCHRQSFVLPTCENHPNRELRLQSSQISKSPLTQISQW